MRVPELVVHCDWSKDPRKRWMARGLLSGGDYTAGAAEPVGSIEDLLYRLRSSVGRSATVVVGFDFPIGIPIAYAALAGARDFKDFLRRLGEAEWTQFYDVARTAEEISIQRPFYPLASIGAPRRTSLVNGLGLDHPSQLYRLCERRHAERRNSACPLFWTLGPNQVGRAAIAGWKDILSPAVAHADNNIRLWPFDGTLSELVDEAGVVIAETYPGEVYGHLGVQFSNRESKTKQADRQQKADQLISWANRRSLDLDTNLATQIQLGFGTGEGDDDAFDAVIGLFGMLDVILGRRPEGCHPDPAAARVEGWILGQVDSGVR